MHNFTLTHTLSAIEDTATTDLAAAYDVPTLERVERKVTFSRVGAGQVSIQDTVEMKPGASVDFESVFTPLGTWTPTGAASGLVTSNTGVTVNVCITASALFTIDARVLTSYNVTWTRVGVKVVSTKRSEKVKITVLPGSTACP
ncbi:hypothetical protein H310_09416 [Aphanomyces invadans]|uniref:Uncharacterized protein n=1 Tax=Aphanomyces invadans TaxID=157072 RepID=A0A024TV49_9STRA|nr:hypothetical protein H310_09416 [Aphanomyces invadans]ETV97491.1 hypothetical protein H310_09416 [Aphanomyces invadans]|eukprot:XP_008873700.1 hypothetical protein H310_09416 [Aphanomyces invadans]